jgi:ABC-type multidrug transport system ATPase subunit
MNPPARPDILRVQTLSFAYPGQPALFSDWSAAIGAGTTLVHGDTGSGKSTLLRVLAGAVPASGRLTLAGVPLDDDADAYRRHVFFCDPTTRDFDRHTARACTAQLSAGDSGFDATIWQCLVEGFALAPHLDKSMFMLSTGSKRKVWLAAALASGRALVLLDEPTGGLDAASIGCLWRALAPFAQRPERAIVVASAERIDQVPLAGSIELPLG